MNRPTTYLISIIAVGASITTDAESSSFLEVSAVLREHSYDFDVTQDGTRYFIDEQFRSGWKISGGWSFAPSWTLLAEHTRHNTDNADGVILSALSRTQAPIFYTYQRASIGLQKEWQLSEDVFFDARVRYQHTEQGVGDFFIESDGVTFELDAAEGDVGLAMEIALQKNSGNWEFELLAGYDPHAGFELGSSGVDIKSSGYMGLGAAYRLGEQFTVGLNATSGKVSDLAFTVGVAF